STQAASKDAHLNDPNLGSRLAEGDRAGLKAEGNQVQIVVSDGLSAPAVHHNLPRLYPALEDALTAHQLRAGVPIVARYGRVKLAEEIGVALDARLVVYLLGERPGGDAQAAQSLSAYLVFRPALDSANPDAETRKRAPFEYTVISNIHDSGL